MQRLISRTALALLCSLPLMSNAARGIYLDGNFGQSFISQDNVKGTVDSDDGFGFNTNIGYQFSDTFAMEAGYTNYANASLTHNDSSGHDTRYSYDITTKYTWLTRDKFNAFAKLGVGYVSSSLNNGITFSDGDTDKTNTNVYYGIGLSYSITDTFAINAQYNTVNGNSDIGDSSLIGFGATFFPK